MSTHMRFVLGLSFLMFVPVLWHFATVFGYFGDAPDTRTEFFLRVGIIAGGFILLSVVTATIVSARAGKNAIEPDERERLIEIRAERNGGWILMAGLVGLMWFAFAPMEPMDVANFALAVLAIGEAIKLVSGVIYLRGRA